MTPIAPLVCSAAVESVALTCHVLTVRVQAVGTGPTTLHARVWPSAGTEPSTWQVNATDSTAAL